VEHGLHRFVRLLRAYGVRVSVTEALDAMRAAAQPGTLADRETFRCALQVALVKDRRDRDVFDALFDRYFQLVPAVLVAPGHGHAHAHDDLADEGEVESFTMSQEPSETPQQGHSHGKPDDIRDFFRQQDLAARYNLHQEANKIDLASMTEEIVLSKDQRRGPLGGARVQLETSRLHNSGVPGRLSRSTGTRLDVDLTVAEEQALLQWLADPDADLDEETLAALGGTAPGAIANLPELLKRHIEALAANQRREVESPEAGGLRVDRVGEAERHHLEETLRRLARTMPGALTHRRAVAGRGRVDPGRTMRANMRYEGVPFRPVTVARKEDRPRLVVLADVSLSVRRTARFTLHFVHGLQRLFRQVRTFVFVADLTEITDLFEEHQVEGALDVVFGGEVLDVDVNSDYGSALQQFHEEFATAVSRRSTVVVLGRGRLEAVRERRVLVLEAGFPKGVVNVVPGPGAVVVRSLGHRCEHRCVQRRTTQLPIWMGGNRRSQRFGRFRYPGRRHVTGSGRPSTARSPRCTSEPPVRNSPAG
jgi:uncharacterized protein with von Willebrand factor type A (vWA) domain